MFFNQDILFRSGPLALVWLAGNEEFKNKKGRRNKEFQKVLLANVLVICKDLRSMFPNMGAADGLGLKKMGILVKGVGIIYDIKLGNLLRDVQQAIVTLKRPVTIHEANPIDCMNVPARAKSKPKGRSNIPEDDNNEQQDFQSFVERMPEDFGIPDFRDTRGLLGLSFRDRESGRVSDNNVDLGYAVQLTPPPVRNEYVDVQSGHGARKVRKRAREDENDEESLYRDVMKKLRFDHLQNKDAHCLPDDNIDLLHNNDTSQDVYEFDRIDTEFGANPFQPDHVDFELCRQEANIDSPPAAPPSRIELGPAINETTPGHATRPENVRGRRNLDPEPNISVEEMVLPDIEDTSRTIKRTRLFRPSKLIIDSETNFSLKKMMNNMNAVKAGDTIPELDRILSENRALGKSQWKFYRKSSMDTIFSAGRLIHSSALKNMVQETLALQLKRPEKMPWVDRPEMERQGEQSTNTASNMASVLPDRTGADIPCEPTSHDILPAFESANIPEQHIDYCVDEVLPPNDQGFPETNQDYELAPQPQDHDHDGFKVPEPYRSSRRSKRSGNDKQAELLNRLEDKRLFTEMYSIKETSRKKAAMAMFTLLKLQGKREIFLHQDEPYGPILVEKLTEISEAA